MKSNSVNKATITVYTSEFGTPNNEVVQCYELEYADARNLHELYKEARRVWDEYHVVCETESFTQAFSHTYAEEFRAQLMEEHDQAAANGELDEYFL